MSNICFSGAAEGADFAWGEFAAARGDKVVHYSFKGHQEHVPFRVVLSDEELERAQPALDRAAKTLRRDSKNRSPYVTRLLQRNWYQIKDTSSVYAISSIKNKKVQGGTGWAVQMAIDAKVPLVYCFDQVINDWFGWSYEEARWFKTLPWKPSGKWTGIGTRELNENGLNAIRTIEREGILAYEVTE